MDDPSSAGFRITKVPSIKYDLSIIHNIINTAKKSAEDGNMFMFPDEIKEWELYSDLIAVRNEECCGVCDK